MTPLDALDPGPNGEYPHWPRLADGSWDKVRMPAGETYHRRKSDGKVFKVDVTPTANAERVTPPDLKPEPEEE